jgi:NAD(P)-dependent dehydrogenase (short-subunit alcohol dehydrogenase family)
LSVDLSGAVSVVIGATVGIGSAIAVGLARSGSTVVIAARNTGPLDETRALAAQAGGQAYIESVDVTSPDSVAALADTVSARYGVPRVLVNSAGVMVTKSAFDLTPADWDLVHSTQLRGPFLACQAFGRQMADVGYGKIINLSSTWAFTVGNGRSSYCAAKAGLTHLTTALASEWAPLGVRVNAIAPAVTSTPAAQKRIASDPDREAYLLSRIPMGRIATPDDMVGAALFLSSNASDFITGETILVDGGWRAFK